jgi:hypothetical protein
VTFLILERRGNWLRRPRRPVWSHPSSAVITPPSMEQTTTASSADGDVTAEEWSQQRQRPMVPPISRAGGLASVTIAGLYQIPPSIERTIKIINPNIQVPADRTSARRATAIGDSNWAGSPNTHGEARGLRLCGSLRHNKSPSRVCQRCLQRRRRRHSFLAGQTTTKTIARTDNRQSLGIADDLTDGPCVKPVLHSLFFIDPPSDQSNFLC